MLWLGSVLFAVLFINAGLSKISGSIWVDRWDRWGYPLWFMYLTGAIEIGAGVLLLWPKAAGQAALALAFVMTGATATHLAHAEPAVQPGIFAILTGLIAWTRLRGWRPVSRAPFG